MFKGLIIFAIVLGISGCTINGKSIDEVMDKNVSKSPTKDDSLETNKTSGLKFHLKWANKEYHDGEEDIKFHLK